MTRQHNQQFHCPNCKTWHSAETMFGRWIRNCRELDSGHGFSVTDQDYWIHRFRTFRGRNFQLLMGVEIKTNRGTLTPAQTDTLHMANQALRTRRQTPTKELEWQAGNTPTLDMYSMMAERVVRVRVYGIHVLTFSGLGPEDSEWMEWDGGRITKEQLIGLLRFDLDPDWKRNHTELRPLDLRNHHAMPPQIELPILGRVA